MRNHNRINSQATRGSRAALALFAALALTITGCEGEKSSSDGTVFNAVILPTDSLLNLACEDVGINLETCVLEDPENPFTTISVPEFDENNPQAPGKQEFAAALPSAKSRFYFWATALARRPSGENQFFTAQALHEVFTENSDPIIQEQALKAYRSTLDNFFGSVTFFVCCEAVNPPSFDPVPFPFQINLLVGERLYSPGLQGFARLVPGNPIFVLELFGEWGYTYVPPDQGGPFLYVNGG